MIIAQITDFHCLGSGLKVADQFDTNARLEGAVHQLNTMDPKPDLVVCTGDIANDGRAAEYANAADILDRLTLPFRVIAGNHDDRALLRATFPGLFAQEGNECTFVVADQAVRVIGLDTVVDGHHHGEMSGPRVDWLARQVADDPIRPTLLVMHHPPFRLGVPRLDAICCQHVDAFGELVARFTCIEAISCGHLHRTMTGRFAGVPCHVAPSTSHQLKLRVEDEGPAWTDEPPGMLLHHWTGEMLVTHYQPIGDFGPAVPLRPEANVEG